MSIAVTDDHRSLSDALRDWAASIDGPERIRQAESRGERADVWTDVVGHGVPTIAVPAELGGGGGGILDVAVAVEACAYGMVPGPILGTVLAATVLGTAGDSPALKAIIDGAPAGVALEPLASSDGRLTGAAVVPGIALDWIVVGDGTEWFVVAADQVTLEPVDGFDLTRGASRMTIDVATTDLHPLPGVTAGAVRRAAVALAAAEASGVAGWCLATAVEYAKVREQFGQPIGRFQAVKHLCASMLEDVEAISAAAWDAASIASEDGQGDYAADVAATVALDGAVRVAQNCIQVLGGIGFTFEHSAHLYLRRAVALRSWLGGSDRSALSLAHRAVAGERRALAIDLGGEDADI
ncbi:MAG TPA: acyl-CoA dehydrogenase, partial [Aeromicrobium sp.]|nr:acyl-CoA dehydrogenase [Aeromicrobium sp.]